MGCIMHMLVAPQHLAIRCVTSLCHSWQVCVDELRSLAREENVKSLPVVHIYKPGDGQLVAIEVPLSKLKNLRTHLRVSCTCTC
jgi:hypothetical protein